MTKYTVTFNDKETTRVFNSVTKAVAAIEESFQCGTKQSLREIKSSLRLHNFKVVNHCMADDINCWIEKH